MRILVTGGAGFIGSALVRHLIAHSDHAVLNFDKLTYAGRLASLDPVARDPRYRFVQGDICDAAAVGAAIAGFRPDVIAHLAAESHVDRSIDGPGDFIQTNIVGTFACSPRRSAIGAGWTKRARPPSASTTSRPTRCSARWADRRLHRDDPLRSPFALFASKAASDHLVRAWGETYACPCWSPIARTITGPIIFPRS